MMEIPRCATRAIRESPSRELHLASETEAFRPHASSAAPPAASMPVPGQPRPAHTSTPAVAAWGQALSRIGKAPPPWFVPVPRVQPAMTSSTVMPCGGIHPGCGSTSSQPRVSIGMRIAGVPLNERRMHALQPEKLLQLDRQPIRVEV